MRKRRFVFSMLFFTVCLMPFILSFFPESRGESASEAMESFPDIRTSEGWNVSFLQDAGKYYEKNFGFRDVAVTVNSWIYAHLLGTSAVKGVIVGTDGWLYYSDSLDDYLGRDSLSDRSLFNIAHTVSMVERNLELLGIRSVFAIAPNKNTLYGIHMPYYDSLQVDPSSNLYRLEKYLKEENVTYVDLKTLFANREEVLYHRLDSHWTNKGAAIAANAILKAAGKEKAYYAENNFVSGEAFSGDLERMMYPACIKTEDESLYGEPFHYSYTGETGSNFDPMIETVNTSSEGGIVMFRDSFGNAILPYIAEKYRSAYFSRGVPYQINEVFQRGADTVVFLRAERFIPEIAENPPVMEALPLIRVEAKVKKEYDVARLTSVSKEGYLLKITGLIDSEYLGEMSRIFVRVNGELMYEAFPQNVVIDGVIHDSGFSVYLNENVLAQKSNQVEIFAGDDVEIIKLLQTEL